MDIEDLRLSDAKRAASSHSRAAKYWRRSPRLPTPEPSRSSNETFDNTAGSEGSHTRRSSCQLDAHTHQMPTVSEQNHADSDPYRQNRPAPHSPPYGVSDFPKPSLPPLKIVLRDSIISSPPQTPTATGPLSQPSPCEPAYVNATFKPPSLYPNKKQRTEGSREVSYTHAASSNLTSPRLPSLEYKSHHLHSQPATELGHPHRLVDEARRLSIPPLTAIDRIEGSFNASVSSVSNGALWPNNEESNASRTPNRTPMSGTTNGAVTSTQHALGNAQSHAQWDAQLIPNRQGVPFAHRKPSLDAYSYQPGRLFEPARGNHLPPPPILAMPLSPDSEVRHGSDRTLYERHDRLPPHAASMFQHGPYETGQSPFFMPSHYEYQHGKARKRSNLPKQSTEIMKTWFDQNITNPYPSEEQKAVFSSVTGISMTQVSNWFINHRRRCPELRERRDRTRTSNSEQ